MQNLELSKAAQVITIVGIGVTLASTTEAAETWSDWGSVTSVEAGWIDDSMLVFHTAPMVNPDNCPVNVGYATNVNDPGHDLFHTVALSAFLNNKQVRFLVSGCWFGKPRLIAVGVR